jgi:hypothetical protein
MKRVRIAKYLRGDGSVFYRVEMLLFLWWKPTTYNGRPIEYSTLSLADEAEERLVKKLQRNKVFFLGAVAKDKE